MAVKELVNTVTKGLAPLTTVLSVGERFKSAPAVPALTPYTSTLFKTDAAVSALAGSAVSDHIL